MRLSSVLAAYLVLLTCGAPGRRGVGPPLSRVAHGLGPERDPHPSDDILLNTTDLHGAINGDGTGRNPLQQPHHIILNLAIGGTNGGDPGATRFPARLEVDYVRVYRRIAP